MEVMVAVQSGTLLHALRVQLKRGVSARIGGDYNEVSHFSLRVILHTISHFRLPIEFLLYDNSLGGII